MEDKRQETRKIFILFVLCLVIVGVWSRVFLKKKVPTSPFALQSEQKTPFERRTPLPSGELQKLEKARMTREWERNPFLAIGEEKEATYLFGLSLTGILWDEERPLAMINNVVVGVNDTIGSYTIKKISSDMVILEREGEEFILRLGTK